MHTLISVHTSKHESIQAYLPANKTDVFLLLGVTLSMAGI
jgi:hypothetical protein